MHPFLGSNWSAGFAAFMMYIGIPILLLRKWNSEWKGPVIKVCNHIIAAFVFLITLWYLYVAFYENSADTTNAIKAFIIYGFSALYYLFVGRTPYGNVNKKNT